MANDETLRLWDVRTGRQRLMVTLPSGGNGLSVAFAPGGDRIAVEAGGVAVFGLSGLDERRHLLGHTNEVLAIAYHPSRAEVASVGWNELIVWDPASGRPIRTLPLTRASALRRIAYSADGRWLATSGAQSDSGQGEVIELWEAKAYERARVLSETTGLIRAIAFDASGRRLAAGLLDGTTTVCDVATGRLVGRVAGESEVRSVALLADGSLLLVASSDGRILLHDLDRRRRVRETSIHAATDGVQFVSYAIDTGAGWLAAGGSDGSLRNIGLPDLALRVVLEGAHKGGIEAMAIRPNGGLLATAGQDRRVVLRDPRTLQPAAELAADARLVRAIAFHPDGTSIAFGGSSEPVVLWDLGLVGDELAQLGLDSTVLAGGPRPGSPATTQSEPVPAPAASRFLERKEARH